MKFLKLLGARLRYDAEKSRLVFWLLCIVGVATSAIFLYFYGNILPFAEINGTRLLGGGQNLAHRTYQVQLPYYDTTVQRLTQLAEKEEIDSVEISLAMNNVLLREWEENGAIRQTYGRLPLLAHTADQAPSAVRTAGRITFSEEQPYEVVIPFGLSYQAEDTGAIRFYQLGESFEINGTPYEIIGNIAGEAFYISFARFAELWDRYSEDEEYLGDLMAKEPTVYLQVYSVKVYGQEEDPVSGILRSVFPDSQDLKVTGPWATSAFDTTSVLQQAAAMGLLYLLMILLYLYMFLYMVEQTADMAVICRIVGASGRKLGLLYICEILVISLGSSLAGALLHGLLYQSFFSSIAMVNGLVYTLQDYVIVIAVMALLTLLAALPFTVRAVRLSPVAARRNTE